MHLHLGKQKNQPALDLKDFELKGDGPAMLVRRVESLKSLKRAAQNTSNSVDEADARKLDAQAQYSLFDEASILQQPIGSEAEERIKLSREASTSGR